MSKTRRLSSETKTASSPFLQDSPSTYIKELSHVSLKTYCSKKSFEIEIVFPFTNQSPALVEKIVAIGKGYEQYSGAYFITYDDVLELISRLCERDAKVELPKNIKENAQRVISEETKNNILSPLEFLALTTKLKVIETMYKNYSTEVGSMQRRHKIHEELTELIQNCEEKGDNVGGKSKNAKKTKSDQKFKKTKGTDKGTKPKKSQSSKTSMKKQTKSQIVIDDYTEIQLDQNDTTFDYNIDNHFMYFILTGFSDPLLLQELIKIQVPVSTIIDVGLHSQEGKKTHKIISKLEKLFETPQHSDYLENTVWMKYRTDGTQLPKEVLEEFLHVVKKINSIKRQHLAYIKDLSLCNLGSTPKKLNALCFTKYTRILGGYPIELINIPLIVNALIEEICWRELGRVYSLSDLTSSSSGSENTINAENEVKPYRAHEADYLLMGMKSYKENGRQCYDKTLKYLKLLLPLKNVDESSKIGFRNRAVSTEEYCYCDHQKELYDYLHVAIFNQMESKEFVPKQEDHSFRKNLVTYDQMARHQHVQPKGIKTTKVDKVSIFNDYHMKEDLSTSVLLQLIFKAVKDYSVWDRSCCEVSGATLLRFHDNLNNVGIDTKIWDQSLRTTVCLRDFCRFVAVEENDWIDQNPIKTQVTNEDECQGLISMPIAEIYQEYQYLLGTISESTKEEKKVEFDNTINELLSYPKSTFLEDYFSENGTLLAYDLGPKICKLTGHTTIFHSDDGIKVTIDTTRFITEEPKCTIVVDVDGNGLVFHKNRPSAFHFHLKDETIISFSEFEKSVEEIALFNVSRWESTEDNISEQTETVEEEQKEEQEQDENVNLNDYWLQILRENKVATTFPTVVDISAKKQQLDDNNLNKMLQLFKAAVYKESPIYKISTKPSLVYLKRVSSAVNVPLVHCLKKILFKPIRKRRKIGGYSVLNFCKSKKKQFLKYDFKITLPNGLLITTLSRNMLISEIRQDYKYNNKKERYRIFYATGIVFVKHVDGTITIYRSNGDIIKLSDGDSCSDVDCAKVISSFFQNQEKDVCPYQTTRCSYSHQHKVGFDFLKLYEFGDIPYAKKTILDVDGKKTEIYQNQVTKEQAFYVTNEHDYRKEEIFYEREDGMKSIVEKKGTQTFQFPDGTKIIAIPEFEKELIFIGGKLPADGWVSVRVNYKFEHPDYITVQYDNISGWTHIFLKDATIKCDQESLVLSTDSNIGLEVTSNKVTLLKTCELCESDCISEIYINDSLKFFEMLDSYGKHLICDGFGICEFVSDFVKSSKNKKGCDHKKTNETQRLFILNERDPPSTIFWKDSVIEDKIAKSQNSRNIYFSNYFNQLTDKQTLEFITEVRQSYCNRFTMTDAHDIGLSKNKYHYGDQSKLFYITYQILINFRESTQECGIINDLHAFMENQFVKRESTQLLLDSVSHMLKYISNNRHTQPSRLSYGLSLREQEASIGSMRNKKLDDTKKITVQEIVGKWRETCKEYKDMIRNKKFVGYFHSDYYRDILITRGLNPV